MNIYIQIEPTPTIDCDPLGKIGNLVSMFAAKHLIMGVCWMSRIYECSTIPKIAD